MVYPSYKPTPHGVPVGYVGPAPTTNALSAQGSALRIHTYASEAAVRSAIEHREVYGAMVDEKGRQQCPVAPGASPVVAQLLRETVSAPATTTPVTDVAPLSANDPRGATVNALVLPLISISLIAAVALSALRLRRRLLLGALGLFSLLGGIGIMLVVGTGLGALPGSFIAIAGVMALTILAISVSAAGFHALLGKAGVPLAAVLFLFIGSPASANGSAPQMLPDFWRQIGPYLPLGASGSGIRNTSYFDGNAVASPLLVLSGYALLGVVLLAAADVRRRRLGAGTGSAVRAHDLGEERSAKAA